MATVQPQMIYLLISHCEQDVFFVYMFHPLSYPVILRICFLHHFSHVVVGMGFHDFMVRCCPKNTGIMFRNRDLQGMCLDIGKVGKLFL